MEITTCPNSDAQPDHVVLFPFMSKGHTIPILNLAHLLLRHRPAILITVFTTPTNHPIIANFLSNTTATIIVLPFPRDIPEIPPGLESTDKLPSMSLFPYFALSTERMQPAFERELQSLPPVSFLVSDGFLWWTLDSANKFGFPRFFSYGMNMYSTCVCNAVTEGNLPFGPESDEELITIPPFPWIKVTKSDFDKIFSDPEPKGPLLDLTMRAIIAAMNSKGQIVNSFYELEAKCIDHWDKYNGLKTWMVGPLCLAQPVQVNHEIPHFKPPWIKWLDQKQQQGKPVVLYVAFGTQAEISAEQHMEISKGLEESKVSFLWVIRKKEAEFGDGFEERVKERGIIVKEWVDQREILEHQCVQGFLSHRGWNSVIENVCAGVPILAWPMMAEQPLNARMVVEEIEVGVRVETCDGSVRGVRGFVKWEGLEKTVKELMEGEEGKKTRKNVKRYADMAKEAMKEGTGSSWCMLDKLIRETCNIY